MNTTMTERAWSNWLDDELHFMQIAGISREARLVQAHAALTCDNPITREFNRRLIERLSGVTV